METLCPSNYIDQKKGLRLDIHSGLYSIFLWFNAAVIGSLKHVLSLLFGVIVAFLFFIELGESMYDPPLFKLIL